MKTSSSCPSLIESYLSHSYCTSLEPVDISNLTGKQLMNILKSNNPDLNNNDLMVIANKINRYVRKDSFILNENKTNVFQMGKKLGILIGSLKYGHSNLYKIETPLSNGLSIKINCTFCNKSVTNHHYYQITNLAGKTFRFTPLALHFLKYHGFCGMDRHRIAPSDVFEVLKKN